MKWSVNKSLKSEGMKIIAKCLSPLELMERAPRGLIKIDLFTGNVFFWGKVYIVWGEVREKDGR